MVIRMAKIQNLTILNASEDTEQQKLLFTAGRNPNGIANLEVSLEVPHKTKHCLTMYNTAIILLVIYPKELKT